MTNNTNLHNFASYFLQKLIDENILVNKTQILKIKNELMDSWIVLFEHNQNETKEEPTAKNKKMKKISNKKKVETPQEVSSTNIEDCPFTTPLEEMTQLTSIASTTNVAEVLKMQQPSTENDDECLKPEEYILQNEEEKMQQQEETKKEETQQEKKEKIEIPQVFKDLFAINKDEKNKTFIIMKKKYLEMLECLYNNENYNNLPINGQFYDMMENFAKGKFSKVNVAKELQEKFLEEFMKIKLTNQIVFVSERARHLYLNEYIEQRKKKLEKNH
jgi:hypothetical protein